MVVVVIIVIVVVFVVVVVVVVVIDVVIFIGGGGVVVFVEVVVVIDDVVVVVVFVVVLNLILLYRHSHIYTYFKPILPNSFKFCKELNGSVLGRIDKITKSHTNTKYMNKNIIRRGLNPVI